MVHSEDRPRTSANLEFANAASGLSLANTAAGLQYLERLYEFTALAALPQYDSDPRNYPPETLQPRFYSRLVPTDQAIVRRINYGSPFIVGLDLLATMANQFLPILASIGSVGVAGERIYKLTLSRRTEQRTQQTHEQTLAINAAAEIRTQESHDQSMAERRAAETRAQELHERHVSPRELEAAREHGEVPATVPAGRLEELDDESRARRLSNLGNDAARGLRRTLGVPVSPRP